MPRALIAIALGLAGCVADKAPASDDAEPEEQADAAPQDAAAPDDSGLTDRGLRPADASPTEACLEVAPRALEWRGTQVDVGEARGLRVIDPCGLTEITEISLSEDTDQAFTLASAVELPTDASGGFEVSVRFTPRDARAHNGTLQIVTREGEVVSVSLLGRGLANQCPEAQVTVAEYEVEPLDVVVLDASPTVDPEGDTLRYDWVILDRPQGSTTQPVERFFDNAQPHNGGSPDDVTTPTAMLFIDLAGRYVAELRVTDAEGCESTIRVLIEAGTLQDIHVQLVWRTPADEDETDGEGTDLDLHLLHPNADAWFSAPYDCHYANPAPDWGQLENPDDDPTLDVDDADGAGPENINLAGAEDTDLLGAPYLIGVHYRRDAPNFGPTFATVRVYLRGELAWTHTVDGEVAERELREAGHFWDVAHIEWPEGRVVTRDRYYEERP